MSSHCAYLKTYTIFPKNTEELRLGGAGCLIIIEFFFSTEASSHALASLSVFHPALFTGFEVNRVLLDLFDDSFLLDFPLEPFKSLFDRFAVVNDNKCH